MGVPLPWSLDEHPGMLMIGMEADRLAAGSSSHPHDLGRACSYPAGKDVVLQGPRKREGKQEVAVAHKKVRWKRGNLGFALCFQEGLDKALVGGMKITHSLLQLLLESFIGKVWGNWSLQQNWLLL